MILGIDAATEILHLALVDGERAWTRRTVVGIGRSHSGSLLPEAETLLAEAGISVRDLTGVAACAGPGGFTSLRIGVATAEGLALSGLPAWGFSAFELRHSALREAGFLDPCWIVLDGQRQDAFVQRWETGSATPAAKHPLTTLPALLHGEAWWCPDTYRAKAEAVLGRPSVPLPDEGAAMLAGLVALLRDLPKRQPENPIHPFYLRETDAEANFPDASRHLSEALRRGVAR